MVTYYYKIKNNPVRYASIRILFYAYGLICISSLGLAFFLFGPLTSYYFFDDLRFWRYFRFYPKLTNISLRVFSTIITERKYGFIFTTPLSAKPLNAPDQNKVKISPTWKTPINTCGTCTSCCDKIKCPILDKEKGLCLSYGSFFWRYFNCGRYPISKKQIKYYNCLKWEMQI